MRISSWFVLGISIGLITAAGCGPGAGGSGIDGGAGSCTAGTTRCELNKFETCDNGTWSSGEECADVCDGERGCVDCTPGLDYCVGDDVYGCDADGNQTGKIETCSDGKHCSGGQCVDLCTEAEANRSYVGCEYWAVDVDNGIDVYPPDPILGSCLLYGNVAKLKSTYDVCYKGDERAGLCDVPGNTCPAGFTCGKKPACVLDAAHSPFAVVVSNPQSFDVTVTLTTESGSTQTETVAAGQVSALYPKNMGFPDRSVDNSGQSKQAFKLTSDAPIVAYQFNPLDNVDVFSNDGSLLIPRHAFDTQYYALTWPTLTRRPDSNDLNGYVTAVAWQDGTEVEVTPTANVRGGLNGFGTIMKGQTKTFMMDAYDVLNLEAVAGGDLTGTLVRSKDGVATFGVYAGHEATVIPNKSGDCCADHLEEMMFPTSTWGKEYAVARSQSRGKNEADVLRVLAQSDGTTVTFNPAPAKGSCATLDTGEFCTVDIKVDTTVSSNNPILVGHLLKSVTDGLTGSGSGDPSLALAVPTEQFRRSYTFLIPQDYQKQYISVVAPSDKVVNLDGEDVTSKLAPFGGSWLGGRILVPEGQHTLECSDGCGLEVYGYSDAVSYLFAGGLDLEQIVVE